MKIMLVNHDCEVGGASLSMLNWTESIPNENIIYLIPKKGSKNLYSILDEKNRIYKKVGFYQAVIHKDKGIKNIVKNMYRRLIYCIQNVFLVKKYAKYARLNKVDFVYSNTSTIDFGYRVAKKAGIKHCCHIREFLDQDHNLMYINNKIFFEMFQKSKIIFISECLKKYWEEKYPIKECVVIYNKVKYNENFVHDALIENNHTINILIAGQVKETKGQLQAIKAIEILKSRKDFKTVLYIAGTGPQLKEYKKYVVSNNLDNVIFLGFTKKLEDIRKSIDVSLICSFSEAFGRVTVESLYYENFVIASNCGANVEIINHGKNGFLYEYNNINDLVDKIDDYYHLTFEEKKEIVKKAKQEAIESFSNNISQKIFEFLDR